MSMDVAFRAHSLPWLSEHTVDAKIDSREPQVPEEQNDRHLRSLTEGWALPAQLSQASFLMEPRDHLVPLVQGGNGGQGAFSLGVQTSVYGYHWVSPRVLHL